MPASSRGWAAHARGVLLLATKPRVEPHGTLQQPEQRSRLPRSHCICSGISSRHMMSIIEASIASCSLSALLEERCLSTRHGERLLERHCLGHIFLVRGLGDVGERAPDG